MKNLFSLKTVKKTAWLVGLSLSALTVVNCTSDETIDLEENNALNGTNSSFATPVDGKIYTITHVKSGRTLDINGASNSNGANLQLWGTDSNTSSTHRQWEIDDVGDGYVRFKGVDSGKSLEVKDGNNSNGANIQQQAYSGDTHQEWQIISVGDGEYRIKNRDSGKSMRASTLSNGANVYQHAWKGWESQKWYFTEVGSTPPDDGDDDDDDDDDTPGGVLGITNNDWKLNGFTATPSASATYYDDVAKQVGENISTWSNPNYFYEQDGWAVFKCYRGLGTSESSDNPRVELRERDGNGNNASWRNEENRWMQFTVRVDQLSRDKDNEDGVVCVGQIHGPNGSSVDDIVRVQFHGSAGQTSGNVRIKISGDVADANGGSQFFDNGYKLDTEYVVRIAYNSDDSVVVTVNGNEIYDEKMDEDEDENYFKVGCYLQESDGASFDGSSAIVRIKNLSTN